MNKIWSKIKWTKTVAKSFAHYVFIIVLVGGFLSLLGIYRALVSKRLFDAATTIHINELYKNLIIIAIIMFSDILLKACISVITSRCSLGISSAIQKRLYEKVFKTKWLEILKYHSGDILTRMTSDVESVTSVIVNTFPNIISFTILLIGSFAMLLFYSPFLACVIVIVSPVTILVGKFYSSKLKKIYTKSMELESEYRSFFYESIQNMLIVKAFCLQDRNLKKVKSLQNDRLKLVLSRAKLSVISNTVLSSGASLSFFLVFLWGAITLSDGVTTFGTLIALVQIIGNIQGPFSGLASSLPQVVYALASIERLMELEDLRVDSDCMIVREMRFEGISFEGVEFGYKNNIPILKDISVSINAGENVALIGASGEGKTTFIHLILALINPVYGNIYLLNGQERVDASVSTRRFISYVPQGNSLFSGTIADNLRCGNQNSTDEEIESALKSACAWDFVGELSNGIYTKLGERGAGLSAGQAQRISIARALLHKAPILLLDEATSALDPLTEIEVLKSIKNLNPAPTCIIITHRPAALKICDRIFKIEDGTLSEQESLMESALTVSN